VEGKKGERERRADGDFYLSALRAPESCTDALLVYAFIQYQLSLPNGFPYECRLYLSLVVCTYHYRLSLSLSFVLSFARP
jgi:hypothetical protein